MDITDYQVSDSLLVSSITGASETEFIKSPFAKLNAYGKFIIVKVFANVTTDTATSEVDIKIYRRTGDGKSQVGSIAKFTKSNTSASWNLNLEHMIIDYVENLESVQYSASITFVSATGSNTLNSAVIEVGVL
jgi:hypothetical protein